jgi:hypothetical protein
MAEATAVFVPTAPSVQKADAARRGLPSLEGRVVGFIDNAKPNFNHLVDDLATLLVRNYRVREVIKRRKRAASIPAPAAMVAELADACDLVITGSGD